ncbi:MAG: DUF6713 family protein [Leptospiraceae bacterium]|nr:DUF6713 family protein [Leptospiraceae bacterium]
MENLFFSIAVSFLFIHELDAIKAKEWKLFIILKDLSEEKAYSIWLALHFPLFLLPILLCSKFFSTNSQYILQIGFDLFLMIHLFLHILFRNYQDYKFSRIQSHVYIILTSVFAFIDILYKF